MTLISSVIFLFVLYFNQPIFAQSPTASAQNVLSDYLFNYNQYRLADNRYIVAKNEYQTYKTLSSKQKALDETKNMLLARTEVVKTYLLLLRQRLQESPGITQIDRDPVVGTIDTQISWVEDQKNPILSAGTLDDLVKISGKFEDKYPELEETFYTALTHILAGKEQSLWTKSSSLTDSIKATVLKLRAIGTQTDIFERWLVESQSKLDRAQDKHTEALDLLVKISEQGFNSRSTEARSSTYSQIQGLLAQENIYLKETMAYLSEIIKEAANEGI